MAQYLTFDVMVEHPSSDANVYAYDESTRAVRLEAVIRVGDPAFANRGIVTGSVTARGEPLRVYLISDLPVSPQTRVAARAVGALEFSSGELLDRVIVAVPLADARYATVSSFNALPGPYRAALQRLIEESAHWLDASSAEELVHLARQRARLAQAEQHEERERPAWQVGSEFKFIDRLTRETDLHTQAEAALFTVPYRFQQYLRLCLTPEERILFWVQRPRFTINRIARLGGKTLREGLLLVTDQQLLWMVDPVSPSAGVEYGYIARAVPLERMADARIDQKPDCDVLQITSANAQGESAAFQIEFPASAREELSQAVRLLCAFVPRLSDRRLRRVVSPRTAKIQLDDPTESDRAKTAAVVDALQKALAPQLNGEIIYAQAFVPTWADGGAKLLTVTDRKIHLTPNRTAPGKSNQTSYNIHSVITPEICFSVLGSSWLRATFPRGKSLEIAFPLTTLKGFNACWLALRQLCATIPAEQQSTKE